MLIDFFPTIPRSGMTCPIFSCCPKLIADLAALQLAAMLPLAGIATLPAIPVGSAINYNRAQNRLRETQ